VQVRQVHRAIPRLQVRRDRLPPPLCQVWLPAAVLRALRLALQVIPNRTLRPTTVSSSGGGARTFLYRGTSRPGCPSLCIGAPLTSPESA